MRTNNRPIRVLIVDDSSFMRNTLSTMLMNFPDMQIVGTAKNGMDAIEQIKRNPPDVMTLDVDMPVMNGLDLLDYVMVHHPLPVIMISALTTEGAWVTLQALQRGAVDFIPKDGSRNHFDLESMERQLHDKVEAAFQARLAVYQGRPAGLTNVPSFAVSTHQENEKARDLTQWSSLFRRSVNISAIKSTSDMVPIVVIGSSTGGPNLLQKLVQKLSVPFLASIVIVQHMPKFFTKVFSKNLNAVASFPIREARNGDVLKPGMGFVAPGDQHLFIDRQTDGQAVIRISAEPAHFPYRPSVDCAMGSAAEQFGSSVIGVVVSGMGNDGVEGCQKIKEYGGIVLVQNEASALMYGMPGAVVEAGWADAIISDEQLAECLSQAVEVFWEERSLAIPLGHRHSICRNGLS